MNVEIQVNELQPNLYGLWKFDKRRSLPFTYMQYIRFSSNRAMYQLYNIAVSQVVPILYISNSDSAATKEIMVLIGAMCANGFYKPWLVRTINQFLSKNHFPGVKINIQNIQSSLVSEEDPYEQWRLRFNWEELPIR
jgi:hypothetical protein